MTAMTRRRTAGFTLIELLVVIAILALLTAIGTGAYFRVRTGAQVKASEDTVAKHSSGFMQIWSAELDNARDSYAGKSGFQQYAGQVDVTKAIAGGDVDRARAIWTYLWMKNAFPQTFAEAINPTRLQIGANVVVLQPKRIFSDIPVQPSPPAPAPPPLTPNTSLTFADQATVLLYKILTQSGSRGQTYNEEAIGSLSVQIADTLPSPPPLPAPPTVQYRVFTDAFSNPITYVRWSSGNQGDMNADEYLKGNNPSRDPFDPTGRLDAVVGTWTAANRAALMTNLGFANFANNWQPTLVARGPARDWGTLLTTPTGLVPIPDGMINGYKLRRQGNRGDQ